MVDKKGCEWLVGEGHISFSLKNFLVVKKHTMFPIFGILSFFWVYWVSKIMHL